MNDKLQKIFGNLIPFIMLGMTIVLLVWLLFLFSYVLLWGMVVGGLLWVIALIKDYFSPKTLINKEQGRVIEHDDQK